jgi:hypothetical protein
MQGWGVMPRDNTTGCLSERNVTGGLGVDANVRQRQRSIGMSSAACMRRGAGPGGFVSPRKVCVSKTHAMGSEYASARHLLSRLWSKGRNDSGGVVIQRQLRKALGYGALLSQRVRAVGDLSRRAVL